ncbi:MAG: hypothetical protein HDR41_04090 [Lactobacillus sp.]|nr:hypothetical protein [Lactobacillus sp.]
MKKLLNKLLPVSHPQHFSLGFVEILVGIILIFNDYYFFYPPQLQVALNDDLIGGLAVFYGIKTIKWALQDKNNIRTNRNLLLFASFFWGFECVAELLQGTHWGSPARLMVSAFAFGFLLITFSIIGKSPKTKYSKQ